MRIGYRPARSLVLVLQNYKRLSCGELRVIVSAERGIELRPVLALEPVIVAPDVAEHFDVVQFHDLTVPRIAVGGIERNREHRRDSAKKQEWSDTHQSTTLLS